MDDLRLSGRRMEIRTADLEFGRTLVNCAILDLSASGIRVCVPLFHEVPDCVTVRFSDGSARPARRCWRRGGDIGFEFLDTPATDAAPPTR